MHINDKMKVIQRTIIEEYKLIIIILIENITSEVIHTHTHKNGGNNSQSQWLAKILRWTRNNKNISDGTTESKTVTKRIDMVMKL